MVEFQASGQAKTLVPRCSTSQIPSGKDLCASFHHTPTPHAPSSNFTPDTCSAKLSLGSGMRKRSISSGERRIESFVGGHVTRKSPRKVHNRTRTHNPPPQGPGAEKLISRGLRRGPPAHDLASALPSGDGVARAAARPPLPDSLRPAALTLLHPRRARPCCCKRRRRSGGLLPSLPPSRPLGTAPCQVNTRAVQLTPSARARARGVALYAPGGPRPDDFPGSVRSLLAAAHLLAPACGDGYGMPSGGTRKGCLRWTRWTRQYPVRPSVPGSCWRPASRVRTAYEPRRLLVGGRMVMNTQSQATAPTPRGCGLGEPGT